jgi:hypothetical protein
MTDQPNQDAGGIPYWPEKRPEQITTPQTEALICVCGKPLALSHISWDANYSPHTPEAAAAPPGCGGTSDD